MAANGDVLGIETAGSLRWQSTSESRVTTGARTSALLTLGAPLAAGVRGVGRHGRDDGESRLTVRAVRGRGAGVELGHRQAARPRLERGLGEGVDLRAVVAV